MKREQILDILETISAAYSGFELSEKRIEVWNDALNDADFDRTMFRLKKHIQEKVYPPTVAEIIAKAPPKNEFLEKIKRWEAEANAERNKGS